MSKKYTDEDVKNMAHGFDPVNITRVEFIGEVREFVRYAKEGKKFELHIQDEGRTIKVFEVDNV